MPEFTVIEGGQSETVLPRRVFAEGDEPDLLATFSTNVLESGSHAMDVHAQDIKGSLFVLDEDGLGYDECIGTIEAQLFSIVDLTEAGELWPAYDSRSNQLTAAFERLFTYRTQEWRAPALKAAGMKDYEPNWHLHISSLFIRHNLRGYRLGVRALRLLKRFVARPDLLATAKSFPEEPGEIGNPTPWQIKKPAAYYRSDPDLGFQPLGPATEGWLIANWSILR